MLSLLFTLAIVAAVVATYGRRWRKSRLRKAARSEPGATPERPLMVRSFTDIDDVLRARWCPSCGGFLERRGEGTRAVDGRRLRIARLVCQECEEPDEIFFDTTEVLH